MSLTLAQDTDIVELPPYRFRSIPRLLSPFKACLPACVFVILLFFM